MVRFPEMYNNPANFGTVIMGYFVFCIVFHFYVIFINRMDDIKSVDDTIDYQTAYVAEIANESNYGHDIDVSEMLHAWNNYKQDHITTYRNQSFTSKYTGNKAPLPFTPFMEEFDDSMKHFLNSEQ